MIFRTVTRRQLQLVNVISIMTYIMYLSLQKTVTYESIVLFYQHLHNLNVNFAFFAVGLLCSLLFIMDLKCGNIKKLHSIMLIHLCKKYNISLKYTYF